MGRAPCCDKAKVKKGPWSVEEDALLKSFMANFGNGGNWLSMPKKAGLNRCGKSCRLRWLNYLRPDIKHGDFTEEEDYVIYTLYHTIGTRWSVIASNLPGRTDNDVKNHWNTKLKKKLLKEQIKKNNIVPCGSTINNPSEDMSYWQNIGAGKMGSGWDQNHEVRVHNSNYSEDVIMGESVHKYAQSSSMSHEMSSHSGSSISYVDLDPNNSNSTLMMSTSGNEDEFWMDMLSESFDDVIDGFQLEKKINEIASFLDV